MGFDFDTPVDRKNTSSLKWDKYAGRDVEPMWVADMDFLSPPAVIEALHRRVEHGVFGYTLPPAELVNVVVSRLHGRYGWAVEPEWIVWLPGLVTGINVACRAVGEFGDDVVTAVPVYPPFLSAPKYSRRNLVTAPHVRDGDRWVFDLDALERALTPRSRLLLLCSPQNPLGRVFSRKELTELAALCEAHDMVICSDEIHCELVLDGDKHHIPTATLGPDIQRRCITLMAPSKTFNVPGLGCSFAVISHEALRKVFRRAMAGIVPMVNALGFTGALAAYRDGGPWHEALLCYLRTNRDTTEREVARLPGLSMTHVEATYLAWIDARAAGLEHPAAFFEQAGVGLSDGEAFGGAGFLRLNFGCPRAMLLRSLDRMAGALEGMAATGWQERLSRAETRLASPGGAGPGSLTKDT